MPSAAEPATSVPPIAAPVPDVKSDSALVTPRDATLEWNNADSDDDADSLADEEDYEEEEDPVRDCSKPAAEHAFARLEYCTLGFVSSLSGH